MNTLTQIQKMARTLADLRTSLEVYEGLFSDQENAEIILSQFREIGNSLKLSLTINLIIGCAALFTDPSGQKTKAQYIENMSLSNLYDKHINDYSSETKKLKNQIDKIINEDNMNLKQFRNKHVGHFDLDVKLGMNHLSAAITIDNLKKLIFDGSTLLNLIIKDAQLLPAGHSLAFYTPIPKPRSTKIFLDRLRSA